VDDTTSQLTSAADKARIMLTGTQQVFVCSVVPRMTGLLVQALTSLGAAPVKLVGQDVQVPLKNRYAYPDQVGQDRLVGAYAAWLHVKKQDCIVADFGTAITIDLVTKAGEYVGGIIAPGLTISLEALAARTALLPKVDLKPPTELLGRDTVNSIRSGIVHGCAALCDGLITKLKKEHAPHAKVIGTGGSAEFMGSYVTTLDVTRPHLVLEGLRALSSRR
jgi:type III pantothenate kinase